MKTLCACVVAAALSAGAAASASAAEPDIRHYDLVVTPDFSAMRLEVVATLAIDNPDRRNEIAFALTRRYDTVEVRADSSAVVVTRDGDVATIRIVDPKPSLTLTFACSGPAGRSSDENRAVMTANDLFLLWSDRFYPNTFDDWATVKTTISLPAGFDAIAPGRRVEGRAEGGVTTVFEAAQPTRNFSIFADSRWVRTERTVGGLSMTVLLHPEAAGHAERIFETSADVVSFFTELHGGYAFDAFAFVTIDSIYARRAFNGWVGYSPAYLAKEMERTGHDAHETSILWWGYTTGGAGPGSFQWTEGLGDYVEILYDEARGLPIPAVFERFRADYLATPPEADVPYTELRGNTPQKFVHGKYPWLMHVARYVVGDDAFRAGLGLLFERYRFRTFTMDEFVQTMEEGAGQPLGWWRDEWIERAGVPELVLEYSVAPSGAEYRVEGKIAQKGDLYHISVEVGLETPEGMRVERVDLSGRETRFAFASPSRPSRVVLDPKRWLIARIVTPAAGE